MPIYLIINLFEFMLFFSKYFFLAKIYILKDVFHYFLALMSPRKHKK